MLKYTLYLLPIFLFYQVLIGSQGSKWIETSLSDLEQSAKDGDPYAQGFLALCHIHGDKGLTISHVEAQYFAQQSASKGHWLGDFVLGYLYTQPPIGPDQKKLVQHYLKAFRETDGKLIKLAAQNDPIALYVLGEIFTKNELSPYITSDIEMAAQYYAISARSGYPPACLQSALIQIHGVTGLINEDTDLLQKKGIDLLNLAIEKKLPAAHHFLARCYLEGSGVNLDMEMALIHFQAASDRNFGLSQLALATFFEQGLTGAVDLEKALNYAKKAQEKGVLGAQEKISQLEALLSPNASLDFTKSSVDKSQNLSMKFNKSKSYDNEIIESVPLSDVVQSKYHQSSPLILPSPYSKQTENPLAENEPETLPIPDKPEKSTLKESGIILDSQLNKNSSSLTAEGKRLYWSKGGESSLVEASKVFRLSAEMGDGEAARYLGLMYLQGKGVKKDASEAMKWFKLASERGDVMAKRNLDSLKRIIRQ